MVGSRPGGHRRGPDRARDPGPGAGRRGRDRDHRARLPVRGTGPRDHRAHRRRLPRRPRPAQRARPVRGTGRGGGAAGPRHATGPPGRARPPGPGPGPGDRSRRRRRGRLHDRGARRVAGRARSPRGPDPPARPVTGDPDATAAAAAPALLDPAALQVLVARCAGIAEEMGAVLVRSGFSPNIKERADCSTALFTAAGEVLAQAEHIPVHLGSMPAAVAAAIAAWGDAVRPGDQIIANDPYAGGTHLNDVTLVAPVFLGGTIVGWAANRAHHADVGGTAPGSMPADARTIDEEGIRLAPVLLDRAVEERFVAASRTPDERRGDLAAQVGANAIGCARLAELVDRIGGTQPLEEVVDYGERRMQAALRALPDGEYVFSDVIDSLGPRVTQRLPVAIVVTVTIADGRATFDFTGTAAQRPGNMNAVEAVTVSAVAFALRCATDPTIPANGGAMRPVRVVAPPGTLVTAQPPVAVGAGNVEVSQRIADVCLGALAQAAPDRVGAAGQGTMNNVLIGRADGSTGPPWVYYETVGGG
ncbi:MAG: hydantoinase B/oxoprolinase family protein, partial [Actinobacteria bacterium]|nr:hydantoinase B/oxoprolinase family protein [Actinomycetota bacterium]